MKFCNICGAIMEKLTTPTGIVFKCICTNQIDGGGDDSLMDEEHYEIAESTLKHEVFIENSPHDPAGNTVLKDCPRCPMNYMTLIIIGEAQVVLYTCICGYSATHDHYITDLAESKSAPTTGAVKK